MHEQYFTANDVVPGFCLAFSIVVLKLTYLNHTLQPYLDAFHVFWPEAL